MSPALPAHEQRRLAEQHLPLVKSLAVKMRSELPPELEVDDLIAWGTEGMMQAAARYEPSRGVAFSTFAYYRIRGAMYDGLRSAGRLPRAEHRKLRMAERADDYLEHAAARESGADPAALAKRTTTDTLQQIAEHVSALTTIYVFSLDAQAQGEIEDRSAEAAFDRLDVRGLAPHLQAALSGLEDRERELVTLLYFGNQSLAEAGDRLGLSKSWASRIHARAIRKLQVYFAARDRSVPVPPPLDPVLDPFGEPEAGVVRQRPPP